MAAAMNQSTTLGDLARENPGATRVFLRHRLDFCCRGQRSLAEACTTAGLDAAAILREIADEQVSHDATTWETKPQHELADHIEAHYHAGLRRDLPGLIDAARKVERVHAGKPAVPAGLADTLDAFAGELELHMSKEERVLFPMIRRGARGAQVYMPVRVMEGEHQTHGDQLARIRELTGDLVAPAHACATWRGLYAGLATLETELMQHIHLENNVLFLRASREG